MTSMPPLDVVPNASPKDEKLPDAAGPAGLGKEKSLAKAPVRRHLIHLSILLLVSLITLAPGISLLPLTDRDEALYVQASRQMLESGNWVDIRFQDNPRYKKPVGIYWLQGLAGLASGQPHSTPLWVFRLPSLLGAVLVGLFSYAMADRMARHDAGSRHDASAGPVAGHLAGHFAGQVVGPWAGLLAGLFAVTTVELALEARIAKTDAMLCAAIMASQFALLHAYLDGARRPVFWRNALFWLSLGLAILIKGPVAPMVIGLTGLGITLTERSFSLLRALSPLAGIAAMLAVVLPWLLAIGLISGGDFFRESIGRDVLGKIATAQESHGAPPGTYLLVALATFWPLSVFASLAFSFAFRRRTEKSVRFLFFWAVPAWIVFELTATKLPNYILPMMPALAVLTGLALTQRGIVRDHWWFRLTYLGVALGGLVLGIGLNAALYRIEGEISLSGLALGIVVALTGICASWLLLSGRLMPAIAAMTASAATAYLLAFAVILPQARDLWLSDRIAEAVAGVQSCAAPTILVSGYGEPSVVFRLGTQTALVDGAAAAARFESASCAVAIVAAEDGAAFRAALARAGVNISPAATATGRNVNGLRRRVMEIYVKPQMALAFGD
ncbi:glycosyltransferase family 39 protein [Rhizobium sp. SSA_523]|uniref:ArnT family glycosyltransferase n=1 Tax=Rhizobium sp. SSA_523 TaxID=2952477 RepID=UPI002090B8B4|nr:glycosyltransferase family 39 protein [Rhizobium sp. SSA_523]MCO5732131.1 glycosyltransferase family 39 protein [Rhizobium sp. SSA_523]WKC25625.1 glycosyltransferase family 39 protein [Rhizobium sp. SSA_523]